jgi:DNA-binding SARP family transcriptional activator
LLKMLTLARGRAVPADRLADGLWGDQLPARPGDQLSVLASRLRGVLGADRIVRADGGYSLALDWLDVDALSELVMEAEHRLATGSITAARTAAGAALALTRGPLLPDEPDAEWAAADRGHDTSPPAPPWRPVTTSAPPSWAKALSTATPMTRRPCASS